jgi:Family of unknown function (DUF6717)
MNAISVIYPYKHKGQWVFDDESKELDKEAFVAGADTLLDKLTDNGSKCIVVFSEHNFPDAEHVVEIQGPEMDGTNYYSAELDHVLWLCPALLKYFNSPPENIFFQIKPQSDED